MPRLCVCLCIHVWGCPWRLVFVCAALCVLMEAVGSRDMCLRRNQGEKTSLNVHSSAESNFGILCWSTANKHPISRSILSLQTLHIFHRVEQYFSAIFCLLCIQNAQSAPNMVCVCHRTLSNQVFYLSLCSFWVHYRATTSWLNVGFNWHVHKHTATLRHTQT